MTIKIQLEFEITPNNLEAFRVFSLAIDSENIMPERKRLDNLKINLKKILQPEQQPEVQPESQPEVQQEPQPEVQLEQKQTMVTMDDLRVLLSKKVKSPANRSRIKEKLTEWGVEKIPALKENQLPEMLSFLQTLPDAEDE